MPDPLTGSVGFIGLGAMGSRMAANVQNAGFSLVCYDSAGTVERAPAGADTAHSVTEVAQAADVVLLSLPDGAATLSVVAELAASTSRRCTVVVDTSTVGVAAAQKASERLASSEMLYLDAPVSGGIAGAESATISFMFAGPLEQFEWLQPLIAAFSKRPFHVGTEPGQDRAMKLLNNFLSGIALTATSEALAYGLSQGLDPRLMVDVLNVSSGQNTATADKFPNRILTGTYDAQFTNTLLSKDLRLYEEGVAASGTPDVLVGSLLSTWQRFAMEQPGADFTRIFPFVTGSTD